MISEFKTVRSTVLVALFLSKFFTTTLNILQFKFIVHIKNLEGSLGNGQGPWARVSKKQYNGHIWQYRLARGRLLAKPKC